MTEKPMFDSLFLGVGAMKAGTTWLYALLDRHPDLFFSFEKEIHYFHHAHMRSDVLSEARRMENARDKYLSVNVNVARASGFRNRARWTANYLDDPVDDLWYRNLFLFRNRQEYCCDFSNLYALLDEAAWGRVRAITDRLRVLYILRDPVKRLWSHVKFHLQITGQTANLDRWGPDEFRRFGSRSFIWENAEYGRAVRAMRAALEPEMLKIAFFEHIHADPRKFLQSIEDFLAVRRFDFPQALIDRRVNESVSHPMPSYFPELFAPEFRRIVDELRAEGLTLPETWSIG